MTDTFPSEVFLALLDKDKYDCYEARVLSETADHAYMELAFTCRNTEYTDTILEEDALLEFVNRNGCHNAESIEDHDAGLITTYQMSKDPEEVRRALIHISKNAYKEKE